MSDPMVALWLSETPCAVGLGEKNFEKLASCGWIEHFQPGAFLAREGQKASTFFLIHGGSVALELHDAATGTAMTETLGVGDAVGVSWLVPPHRYHVDVRALEPTDVLVFDGDRLKELMEADADFGFAITRRLLARVYSRLEELRVQRLDLYQPAEGRRP